MYVWFFEVCLGRIKGLSEHICIFGLSCHLPVSAPQASVVPSSAKATQESGEGASSVLIQLVMD